MIEDAPETAGIYSLWDHDRLVYTGYAKGGADNIRARLLAHLRELGAGQGSPTHYSWEIRAAQLEPRRRHANEGLSPA